MPQQPDLLSTAICWLFIEGQPAIVNEPIEQNECIRDTHWYANLMLREWAAYKHHHLDGNFYPLPWYREKAIINRAVATVRNYAHQNLKRSLRLYSL